MINGTQQSIIFVTLSKSIHLFKTEFIIIKSMYRRIDRDRERNRIYREYFHRTNISNKNRLIYVNEFQINDIFRI